MEHLINIKCINKNSFIFETSSGCKYNAYPAGVDFYNNEFMGIGENDNITILKFMIDVNPTLAFGEKSFYYCINFDTDNLLLKAISDKNITIDDIILAAKEEDIKHSAFMKEVDLLYQTTNANLSECYRVLKKIKIYKEAFALLTENNKAKDSISSAV